MADKKIFGGTTPSTVSNKKWMEETDKRLQAWPRVAGPPVVMNPISLAKPCSQILLYSVRLCTLISGTPDPALPFVVSGHTWSYTIQGSNEIAFCM
ncbi:hypothetical protein CMV_021307 [Castanea mollissima]|uniref:Uncharacterized protein n=1 Tax=Castanea mollissima TaxID=60419 RepID=A0A8J4QK21_9ROSI|nr:hypothetical protein CMV_021307 [Castanea mollissima]